MEFDIDAFRAIYPQFADIPDTTLKFMWTNALMISGLETDSSFTLAEKQNLLFMLVCHLATLAQRGAAGALMSATEGSVSVSYSTPQSGQENDWYMLTPCGAAYWQIVKGHRYGGVWFGGSKC
jgi:hypothetical protein